LNYFLSPSKLNLLEDCPRCFWLAVIKKINRPSRPMPSIVAKFDSIVKNYFDRYRALNELPPIIAGQVEGRLSKDMPKTLKYEEENGILLWGRPDDFLEVKDGKTVPFDHKTKSKSPNGVHPAYQLQMSTYSHLLQMSGYTTTNKAFISYYFPGYSELHNGMTINCTVLEVITDPNQVKDLINRAYEILSGPMPDPGIHCEFCKWAQVMIENESIPSLPSGALEV